MSSHKVSSRQRLVAVAALVAASTSSAASHASDQSVTITLTAHGIPHVVAHDWRGLGFGWTTYNAMDVTLVPMVGYTNPTAAASYLQIVSFGPNGPEADAILANSQSSDPTSPFYADQTELYSAKRWLTLPFSREEVAAHAVAPPLVLHPRP